MNTDLLDESDRQAVLLALAELSLTRPGWYNYLATVAGKLKGREMFEQFRLTSSSNPRLNIGENSSSKNMTTQEIENRFTYHKPIGNQPTRYESLRAKAKELATMANEFCPESREKSHAFTCLEDAVMWFNAAIARNENESTSNIQPLMETRTGKLEQTLGGMTSK